VCSSCLKKKIHANMKFPTLCLSKLDEH
jgi:hypothetical protein